MTSISGLTRERPLLWLAWVPAVLISALAEFLSAWETPGQFVARLALHPQGLNSLNSAFFTALSFDSILCWGFIVGMSTMTKSWRKASRGGLKVGSQRTYPIRAAALSALPLSYYAMVGAAVALSHGRLPRGFWPLAGVLVASFVSCLFIVYGLFVLLRSVMLKRS